MGLSGEKLEPAGVDKTPEEYAGECIGRLDNALTLIYKARETDQTINVGRALTALVLGNISWDITQHLLLANIVAGRGLFSEQDRLHVRLGWAKTWTACTKIVERFGVGLPESCQREFERISELYGGFVIQVILGTQQDPQEITRVGQELLEALNHCPREAIPLSEEQFQEDWRYALGIAFPECPE